MSAKRRPGIDPSRTAESWSPEDGARARAAKQETLQRRLLARRARTMGFTLRHSSYGYSLIDQTQSRVDGRNDMTLDDVKRHLDHT